MYLIKNLARIAHFMDEKGYGRSVGEMRGIAQDASMPYAEMPREVARVNPEYCSYCKRCLRASF